MTHNHPQLWEKPANLIKVLHLLRLHGNSRAGHADTGAKGNIQIDTGDKNGVPLFVVERDLRA